MTGMKAVYLSLTFALVAAGCVTVQAVALPEIGLVTADAGLWDPDTGIYANPRERGGEWEREAFFEYRASGVEVRTRAGLRIHGGRSRDLDQKSLRLYFDHGDGPVTLDLFGDAPARLARLILRSDQTPDRILHTNLAESLFGDLGHLGSRQAPVTVTLNGDDWGLYSARERLDPEWVNTTLGHTGEFTLIRDGKTRHGDGQAWWDFLASFAAPADRTSPAWLAGVRRNLDLASYIDWLLILAFGAAADNGDAHNLVLLRLDDRPWRVILWDADDLFRPDNLHNDHFRWFAAVDADEYRRFRPPLLITGDWKSRAPWSALFRGLLENPEFRERFFVRAEELLAGELSVARLNDRIGEVVDAHEPGVARHAARWGWSSPGDLQVQAAKLSAWIEERHAIVREDLAAFRTRHP